MTTTRTAATDIDTTTPDPVAYVIDTTDDTTGDIATSIVFRSGIVRAVGYDHPAAVNVRAAMDASATVDATMAARGTGRGNPRHDMIHHGHTTPTGRMTTHACGVCDHRYPANRFPTLTTPRATGAVRTVVECRTCRDARTAAARSTVADATPVYTTGDVAVWADTGAAGYYVVTIGADVATVPGFGQRAIAYKGKGAREVAIATAHAIADGTYDGADAR